MNRRITHQTQIHLLAVLAALLLALSLAPQAVGQINSLTREEMIKYTAQNPYDRFPDGRPKVPDNLLEAFKDMSSEEVISMRPAGGGPGGGGAPVTTFTSGWQMLRPGKKLIGRAFTLQLMPIRPEVSSVDADEWKKKGNERPLNHQSALDMLQAGDVLVVDAGGGAEFGGIVGDNLSYYIWKKTGAGFVIDGAIRDLEGIAAFDMQGYFKAAVPPAIRGLMVTGINVPVRIGNATVLPGDVVFGDREGVNFIPPQAVEGFIKTAQTTHIHDEWTKKKFDEGKWKSTDIYGSPTDPALKQEYQEYLKQKLGKK